MNTTASITSDVKLSVQFAGEPPIDSGFITFPAECSARTTTGVTSTLAKRLAYSDLTELGTNRIFTIDIGAVITEAQKNLLGEQMSPSATQSTLVYIRSNVASTNGGKLAIPSAMPANSEVMLRGVFNYTGGVDPDGETIHTFTWTQAALNAIGTGNFYCDLILG